MEHARATVLEGMGKQVLYFLEAEHASAIVLGE